MDTKSAVVVALVELIVVPRIVALGDRKFTVNGTCRGNVPGSLGQSNGSDAGMTL